jgi:hypothetical protein
MSGKVVDGHGAGPGGARDGAVGGALVVELADLVTGGGITCRRLVRGCGLAGAECHGTAALGCVPRAGRMVAGRRAGGVRRRDDVAG